jgi:Cu(I)/Ag(I) efflux system membrane fusion protein
MLARGRVRVKLAGENRIFSPDLAGKWISPMHPEIVKDGPGTCDVCGMDLVPAATLGYDSQPAGEAPLVVPASAVLRTGRRAVVYVAQPHATKPTFEGREVVLGAEADEAVVITSGLREGEVIVTQGAFKIDSALQILAKPSMMNPTGDADDYPATAGTPHPAAITMAAEQLPKLLPPYFKLQAALADDDHATAQAALRDLMAVTGHHGPLPDLIHALLAAKDLDAIRRPGFEQLSDALIAAAKAHPEVLPSAVYRMHCPMVYDERGADWLQPTADLRNPYFGDAMLFCGEQVEKWGQGRGAEDE